MNSSQENKLWQTWLDILNMQDSEGIQNLHPKTYLIKQDFDEYEIWSTTNLRQRIAPQIEQIFEDNNQIDLVKRLFSYVLPMVWLSTNLLRKQQRLIIGLNGMQGCGKTTLGKLLDWVYVKLDVKFDSVSLDDFYLDYETRKKLDPHIYKYRGPPGTHSIDIILEFVQKFKKGDQQIRIPIFDKSLYNGQGDRVGYRLLNQDAQIILFEGWMYGFMPVPEIDIKEKFLSGNLSLPNDLGKLGEENYPLAKFFNEKLKNYIPIWELHDLFFIFVPADFNFSYLWRLGAEQKMIAKTGSGMSDQEVGEFVKYYWSVLNPQIYVNYQIIIVIQYFNPLMKYEAKLVQNQNRQIIDCQCI